MNGADRKGNGAVLDGDYLIYLCLAGVGYGCYRAWRRMQPHMESMRQAAEAESDANRTRIKGTLIGTAVGGIAGGVVFGLIAGTLVWLAASGVVRVLG